MIILPAIDLMGGEVVRLRRGVASEKTVYSNDPPALARRFEAAGGDWLHIVDLDAAFTGSVSNIASIRAICAAVSIPCEVGGGIRDEKAIRAALDAGASRVVIGTRASQSIDFVREMCTKLGGERVAVGIDAKGGMIAVRGWTETTHQRADTLALAAQDAGARTIVYTDIATDGMLEGPNFAEIAHLLDLLDCDLIASGGVSSDGDLRKLAAMPRLAGAIVGKALYEGRVSPNLRAILDQ